MDEPIIVAVDIPLVGDARLRNWAKVVDSVDDSRSTGYAFGGHFVSAGGVQDVPAGAILIVYGERGSRTNLRAEARVYTVNADGTLSHHQSAQGKAWARTIRDRVSELVCAPPPASVLGKDWDAGLAFYTTEALRQELERRARGEAS